MIYAEVLKKISWFPRKLLLYKFFLSKKFEVTWNNQKEHIKHKQISNFI